MLTSMRTEEVMLHHYRDKRRAILQATRLRRSNIVIGFLGLCWSGFLHNSTNSAEVIQYSSFYAVSKNARVSPWIKVTHFF